MAEFVCISGFFRYFACAMPHPEPHITGLLRSNATAAVTLILEQYGDALYGLVCRMIPDRAIADEVIQDVMIKVWQHGATYDPAKGKLYTWLASIAWNTSLDRIRSAGYQRSRKSETLESNVYVQQMSEENMHGDVGLQRVLERLEAKYREVIDLVYFGGYSHAEVSEALGIPIGTVKSRVRIAIRELHTALRDDVRWIGLLAFIYLNLMVLLH